MSAMKPIYEKKVQSKEVNIQAGSVSVTLCTSALQSTCCQCSASELLQFIGKFTSCLQVNKSIPHTPNPSSLMHMVMMNIYTLTIEAC